MTNCVGYTFYAAKLYYHVRVMIVLGLNMNLLFTLMSFCCDVAQNFSSCGPGCRRRFSF